jgi:hypothetical protein
MAFGREALATQEIDGWNPWTVAPRDLSKYVVVPQPAAPSRSWQISLQEATVPSKWARWAAHIDKANV